MAEKWTKMSLPPSSGVTNPNPLLSLNHFTIPVAPLTVPGLVTVDLQSASDPSHVQVTFPPSFAQVHVATTFSVVTSAGADGMGAEEAGASLETTGTGSAADGAETVELDPQPARSSAPAAATETATVVIILGACMVRNLSPSSRCTRSGNTEYCCPRPHEQVTRRTTRKTGTDWHLGAEWNS